MRLGALTLTRRAATVAVVYVLWEGRSCNVGVENLRSAQIVEQWWTEPAAARYDFRWRWSPISVHRIFFSYTEI